MLNKLHRCSSWHSAHLMPATRRSGAAGTLAGATAWRLMGSADLLVGRAGEDLGASSSAHHSPEHREVGRHGGKACT